MEGRVFVPILTDYMAPESLQRIQDEFASVLRIPLRICTPEGEPLTAPSAVRGEPPAAEGGRAAGATDSADACGAVRQADVPIVLDGAMLGRIIVRPEDPPAAQAAMAPAEPPAAAGPGPDQAPPQAVPLLGLMASVIARRWNRQRLLRSRIAELATMYRLTAEFAGQRDLQSVLDLVARTVVEVLHAKACSIRLLTADRTELVVKAVANLSPEYLNKGPILLSASVIDQEVVSSGRSVYIADERMDPRVLYPAEAQREGIVSALCAPLLYKGQCEGVIRVYTAKLHEFDWYERSLLEAIAAQAAAAIVNARLYEEAVRAADLRRDLRLAGEVQRRMIPARPPRFAGLDLGAAYVPCFELGGDFYDFLPLGPDNLGVAVCDVVGKGARASLLMASIRAGLRAHATNIYHMSRVLAMVNRDLCADTAMSDFATLFYGVLDGRQKRFTYANAGHCPPLLIRSGQCRQLSSSGGVLGIDPHYSWPHESTTLAGGDVLVLYTDGLTEAMDSRDESFGPSRLEQAALAAVAQGQNAEGIVNHILREVRRFAGLQTPLDDLTLIAIRVL